MPPKKKRSTISDVLLTVNDIFDILKFMQKNIDERFQRVDRRFDEVDRRFDKIESLFEGHDRRISTLEDHDHVVAKKLGLDFRKA